MKKLIFAAFFFFCFILNLAVLSQDEEKGSTKTVIGQQVPAFYVTTTSGDSVKISNLKGKVVLINFFADWCPPCKTEMPHLEKEVYKVFKNKDFYLISIGRENTMDVVKKFKKERNLSFPMAPDENRSVYSLFATKYIPRNVIIDKKGKIVFQEIGFSEEKLKEMIDIIKGELNKNK